MNAFWLTLSLSGTYLALLLLPMGVAHLWRKKLKSKRRSPLTQMLLRAPGETLRNKLEDTRSDLILHLIMLPSMPLLLYAIHISQSYFGEVKESILRIAIGSLFVIGTISYMTFTSVRLIKKITVLRLGYDGEVAVAQELNLLMLDGAYVFHDVPAEGFNIDHVIVGRSGVYAVETKCRMKPNWGRGEEDAHVVYDGQQLIFPHKTETAPLEQARRQAVWLEKWLASAVGESVRVKPALALPGWNIELAGKGDVIVVSGRNSAGAFRKLFHASLSEEMTKRIAHQLEQRCRDVEPGYFQKRDKVSY